MQDKMWELQQKMNVTLNAMSVDVGIIKGRLDGRDGICDQVRKNTTSIERLDDWTQRKDERGATIAWIFGLIGGGSGVLAALKWVFNVL